MSSGNVIEEIYWKSVRTMNRKHVTSTGGPWVDVTIIMEGDSFMIPFYGLYHKVSEEYRVEVERS